MTCTEFQAGLQTAIETRDAAALARLAEHGEQCPQAECRRLWEEERLLRHAIAVWRGGPAPAVRNLSEAVLREIAAAPSPIPSPPFATPPRRFWQTGAMLAAASALLLALLIVAPDAGRTVRLAGRTRGSADALAAQTSTTSPPAATSETPHWQREAPADAADLSSAYVGLAREATSFVTDLAMLVVPVDVDDPEEETAAPPHWLHRLGEHIEPVQDGVKTKLGEWFGPPAT